MISRLAGKRWFRGLFFLTIGVAAGWLVSALWPFEYTSQAILRLTGPAISPEVFPQTRLDAKGVLDQLSPIVLSRGVLTNIVHAFDLYPSPLDRGAEELEDKLLRSVRVEQMSWNMIRVAVHYRELGSGEESAKKAQKLTQDFVSRLIDESIREQANAAYVTKMFFDDQAEAVAKELVKAEAKLRATPASDPHFSVASIDRDVRRKEYESIAQKRADARLWGELRDRKLNQNLELLDPATLPEDPDTSPWVPRGAGLIAGLAAWLLIECRPRQEAATLERVEPEISVREG